MIINDTINRKLINLRIDNCDERRIYKSEDISGPKGDIYGSIFGKRDLLAIDHIMLALFWSHVPNMK